MKSKRLLYPLMIFLFIAGIAVPFVLKQIPLPLRLILAFTDLVAGAGIAIFLRQLNSP